MASNPAETFVDNVRQVLGSDDRFHPERPSKLRHIRCTWCWRLRKIAVAATGFAVMRSQWPRASLADRTAPPEPRCEWCLKSFRGKKMTYEEGIAWFEQDLLDKIHEA